jgi:hypothetical protein
VKSRIAVIACVFVLLLVPGCGEGGTPSSLVRTYEQAILSRDGDSLCGTFAPKLREVVEEQIGSEEPPAGATGGSRSHCGAFYHLLIGYPHENVDRQFTAGELLEIGSPHRLSRDGVVYAKVPAKLRFEFTYTGYSIRDRGKGAATFEDMVWLSKAKDGTWGVVKPSLALVAASNPDVLSERYSVARVNAPPPDPDYSMNRAERTAFEAADFSASFRRKIGHAPLRCGGRSVSVEDPLQDPVTYPTGSALHPAAAPAGNDIERVTVGTSGRRICVAVTFRKKPVGHVRVGFTPRSRRAVFPEYRIEIDPSRGVRGGGLTTGYRYFRGGQQLNRKAVEKISLYGSTVAFLADADVAHQLLGRVPADLMWAVRSTARTGSDQVPNGGPTEYVVIRQSDGRAVKPSAG